MRAGTFLNGRLYWQTEVVYKNGDRFLGCFKDGRANGYGTLKYNYSLPVSHDAEPDQVEEAEYKGGFNAGKRDGFGSMTWTDGSFFKGQWRCGQRHHGQMLLSGGQWCYRGGFRDDRPHGVDCLLLLATGIVFQGNFNRGVCAALGKLLYPNGDMYYGQHREFAKEGVGKMVYLDGTVYEGFWETDRKSGQGRLVYATTGNVYVGEFVDGKRSGRGRFYNAVDQTIYDGEWDQDRRQGEGTILSKEGQIASGDFRADHMEGKLTYQRTLGAAETERVFTMIKCQRD